ncbi:hypothetical protein Shyhy01_18080 [Streptomyces hygroscopicus subsp. hygroscopicus]|uniref:hypothetical protein n=1 Tax=Streptomyces sp. KHY 26 TaxID=3097359 RepID=UPI0024A49EE8|nr:hypothetical protein [Streptomyces hygroscopicus]GLX48858.1 hypothetical protein Shyhy01_18080 [Streptomyces hygroscopicus subsp. hygroscopicus]
MVPGPLGGAEHVLRQNAAEAGLTGGDPVQLGAGPLEDHGQEPRLAVVVDAARQAAIWSLRREVQRISSCGTAAISITGRRPGLPVRGSVAGQR